MATNILSNPSSAPQTQTISQFQLARYVALQNQIEALKEEQKELADGLMGALSSGAQIEPGTHMAKLRTCERRSVAWKDVVVRVKGREFAEAILATTEPTTYTKLIVR